jgi:hypothetical protein
MLHGRPAAQQLLYSPPAARMSTACHLRAAAGIAVLNEAPEAGAAAAGRLADSFEASIGMPQLRAA